jgi:hypothetical protein
MATRTAAPTPRTTAAHPRPVLKPGALLRVEGLALLGAAVALYAQLGPSWWWFAALLLVPDVGLLGYLAGLRVGALTYNLTHTLSLPLALGVVGLTTSTVPAMGAALIWVGHIGMDRAVGYGLKYPTDFRDTHLQRVA